MAETMQGMMASDSNSSLTVEDLRGEQGGAQGGVEDGADAAGRPGQDQDAAVLGLELEKAGQEGAKTGADLGDGALFAGGAAAADGDGGDHDLDRGDPVADVAAPGVEGLDHGVGAVAFRPPARCRMTMSPTVRPPRAGMMR